jgi:Flp pilus assembly pilin Flp
VNRARDARIARSDASEEDEMNAFVNVVRSFVRDEEGQDLLEYALLVALIALVAVGAVQRVGETINTVLWQAIAAASV